MESEVSEIKIEKGVEMPPPPAPRQRWPLGQMEVGDSFPVPKTHENNVRSTVSYWNRFKAMGVFTVRRMEDGTLRVWRTE